MQKIKTTLNTEFVREIVWEIRLNLNQLNERAGFSRGYIYRLIRKETSQISLATIDALYHAIGERMEELNMLSPCGAWNLTQLWDMLIIHRPLTPQDDSTTAD